VLSMSSPQGVVPERPVAVSWCVFVPVPVLVAPPPAWPPGEVPPALLPVLVCRLPETSALPTRALPLACTPPAEGALLLRASRTWMWLRTSRTPRHSSARSSARCFIQRCPTLPVSVATPLLTST